MTVWPQRKSNGLIFCEGCYLLLLGTCPREITCGLHQQMTTKIYVGAGVCNLCNLEMYACVHVGYIVGHGIL